MTTNNHNPFQLMETASQIHEATKDRWLSEEEINFFFNKSREYIITFKIYNGRALLSFLNFCVRAENWPFQIDTNTNNADSSHPLAIHARISKKTRADKEIWQLFRTAMYSFIENDSTLNPMQKEHMKRLTDIAITKAKKYEDRSLHILFP